MNPEEIRKLLEKIRGALGDMELLGGEVRARLQRAEEAFLKGTSGAERTEEALRRGDVPAVNRNLGETMRELRKLLAEFEGIGNDGYIAGRVTRDGLAELGISVEQTPQLIERAARVPEEAGEWYHVTWEARTPQGWTPGAGRIRAKSASEAIRNLQRDIPETRGGRGYRAAPEGEAGAGFGAEQQPLPGWPGLALQMNRAGQSTGFASIADFPTYRIQVDLMTVSRGELSSLTGKLRERGGEVYRWRVNSQGGRLLATGEADTLAQAQAQALTAARVK